MDFLHGNGIFRKIHVVFVVMNCRVSVFSVFRTIFNLLKDMIHHLKLQLVLVQVKQKQMMKKRKL
jgi:anthranilate phosphoribosyltransferase